MSQNNFFIDLIARLQKTRSKQQIKADIKSLGDLYVKLIGNLDLSKTIKNINGKIKGLNGLSFTITPTVNTKGVQSTTKQAINAAQKVVNNNKIHYSFDLDKQKFKNELKNFSERNSKLFSSKEMTAKYNQLLNLANVAKSKTELNALRKQLSAFRAELVACNRAGMNWTDKFKASISHYAQFFSGATFIYSVVNQLRNAWTEAKNLDDSLVDLQKVTSEIEDRDALYKYFDKAMNKAQELNVKVGSLIDSITEFKKLGWSLSDAELGGQWATILENVGDVDIETAIGSIKTSIASFEKIGGYGNDQMDKKLEAYVDLINNMSNKYSIDAEGLSEAIRLSAGTLTEAHTSIEQAATMFATANKYYNDPSYLGNTVKIGSLRMRASKGDTSALKELQEMGEEVDNLSGATSKLREKLLALTGVDIMENENTFKGYYEQLYEISQVIDKLDDTSRANVLETLFGKSRSAGGAALLNGMKESAKAYQDAINSAGSATEEYQTWMQSADAATQRFSNNLIQTYQNFINGNTVRDIANFGSALLEFANTFGIVEGAVKGFLALKIGTFLTNATMAFLSVTKSVEQYGKALQMADNIPNGNLSQRYSTLKNIAQATSSLTNAQLKQVLSSQALSQQDRIRILMMQGMTKEMALQKLAEMNLTQVTNTQTAATTAQTASTFSLKSAMVGLGATIKSVFLSNPIGIALMGISVAISAITSAVSKHNQQMEEMRQKTKEAASEANTLSNEIADLSNKYISLSESVKIDASAKEDLMTTQKELLKKLGLEGEGIDELVEKYGSLSNAIRQVSIDSLKTSQIDLIAGVDTAKEELLDASKDDFWKFWKSKNIITANGKDAIKAFKELEKAGIISGDTYGTGGGSFYLTGDTKTVEGTLENYKKLEDALNTLRDSDAFTKKELTNNSLFKAIYGRYNELKEKVEDYNVSVENLNKNLAQQTMLAELQDKKFPRNEEEFKTFKQNLIDTAIASKQFVGSESDIIDSINSYLSSVPEFEDYYTVPLENELAKVEELKTKYQDISSVQSQISSFTSAQEALNTALSEQSENGIITAETLQKLSNNYENLDSAIEMTTTGIRLNTSEMAKLNAEKKKAIKTELDKKEKELTDAYNKGSVELAVYQETLASCTDTKSEDYEILSNLIEQKKADQEATLGQIGELQKLSMEYQNAISTHNAFIKALSSADQGAGYDAIVSGIEKVKEVWKNGDYGKDELRAFVDYFTYADMSTASIEEIKNAYNDAVTAADKYFTESVKGQQNFLYLLKETKVDGEALAKVDKKGNWTINIKDMDKAAEACGFSVDFLTDCLKKLEEKGFEGAFTDNNKLVDTYAQLQELDKQIETLEKRLANGDTTSGLKQQLDALVKERNKIHVELDGTDVKKAIEEILALQKTIKTTSDQGLISTLQNEQKSIAKKYGVDLEKVLGLDTTDAKSQWELFSETIENADLKTDVVVSANTNPFDKTIKKLTEKEYTAKIGFKVETAGVVSKVSTVLKDIIATLNGNNKEDEGGDAGAYGSANVSGHSHANGSIGISKSQKNVMVSEVKPEMVVDPHNGKYTIYNRPTMLPELPKNAIVFNGDQTEEILKNGMTTSFGKAYVNGNVSGNAYVPGYGGKGKLPTGDDDDNKSSSKKKKSSSKDKDTSKAKDAFSEVIDWIEIKLEKFAKNTEKLVKRIEKYISYINANKAVDNAMTAVKREKNVNQQAYNRYMKQANSVGLSAAYKKKVQNGEINIQTIKDEKLKEKIDEYQKWYEKAQACKDTIAELNEQLTELAQKKLENITDWFDTRVSYKDARKNVYETSIAYREAQGKRGTDNQYKGLVDNNKSKQVVLQNEYKKTTDQLNALVKAGSIKKYSKEWYEWQDKLREIQADINDCKTETIDLKKQWMDAKLTAFDKAIEKCTDLQDELSDLIDLMNSDTFFNESGKLTEDGFTYIGMVGQQLASAKQEVLKYAEEMDYINEEYAKFKKGQESLITSEEDYKARIKEVTENQREAAKAVKDYRDALIDLKVKGIEAEIDALKELAEKNKELLNEEKNRDDYEKSIQDKTKSIDILKRQIAELELSDNRKDKAELKKLKKQLADAQEELAQTEKDHNIEMQEKAIDDATNAYEESRNKEIKEIQSNYEKQSEIIADYLDDVKDNYKNVFSDITEIAERFGVTLTSELKKPWQDATSAINEYKLASQELAELNKKASTTANTNTHTAIKNSINTIKNPSNASLVVAKDALKLVGGDDLLKQIENFQNNPIANVGLNTVNNVLKNLPNKASNNSVINIENSMNIQGNTDERLLGQMQAMCNAVSDDIVDEIKRMTK